MSRSILLALAPVAVTAIKYDFKTFNKRNSTSNECYQRTSSNNGASVYDLEEKVCGNGLGSVRTEDATGFLLMDTKPTWGSTVAGYHSSGEWPKNLASISDAKRYVEWAGVEDLAVHGFTTKVVDGKTHAIVCGGTDKATCEASIKEFDTTGQSANCNANNNRVNQGVVDECYAIPFTSDYILITKSSERCSPKHKYENGASTSGTGKWPIYESWPCDGSSSSSGSGGSSSSGGGGSVILIILLLICGGGGGAYYYGTKIPDGRIGKMIPPKYKWDVIGPKIQAAKAKVSSKRVVAPTPTADSA